MVANVLRSRVRETATSYTGTGNITCAGASSPDLAISTVCAANDTTDLYVSNSTQWMIAKYKVVSTSPAVLQWLYTIENHLNDLTQINFTGGTLDIWMDGPGRREGKQLIKRKAQTGAYTIVGADLGDMIDCTSGTFTLAFTAAATLGDQFCCYIQNSGTGEVTVDPNSTETIDTLTSFIMYPGERRLVFCDGAAFYSIVLSAFSLTYTASATFTRPPGYSGYGFRFWGAGGSGGFNGSGGSGGACCDVPFMASSVLSSTNSFVCGAGALGVTSGNGNIGGDSTFAGLTAKGGLGGNTSSGATGGSAFNMTLTGVTGGSTGNSNNVLYGGGFGKFSGASSGQTVYGGGGGSADGSVFPSVFGGAGGTGGASSATAGTAPGGGGGAVSSSGTTGAGARGECRIWGII